MMLWCGDTWISYNILASGWNMELVQIVPNPPISLLAQGSRAENRASGLMYFFGRKENGNEEIALQRLESWARHRNSKFLDFTDIECICKANKTTKPPKPDASPALQPVQPLEAQASQASQAAPSQPAQTVSPALHPRISPPAQAGFKFLWHCGGGYLSLPIFALCQCGNACNSSCRWLALASSFKELLSILLSKKITKRLGLIENWSFQQQFSTPGYLCRWRSCLLYFSRLFWCTECQGDWEGSGTGLQKSNVKTPNPQLSWVCSNHDP